jgi:hypothetical protein
MAVMQPNTEKEISPYAENILAARRDARIDMAGAMACDELDHQRNWSFVISYSVIWYQINMVGTAQGMDVMLNTTGTEKTQPRELMLRRNLEHQMKVK